MELRRMQQVILEKKGLRKEELERQREPILKMRQEAKRKKERLEQTLEKQEDIFEHTVATLFPERQLEDRKLSLAHTILPDSKKSAETDNITDTILQQEVGVGLQTSFYFFSCVKRSLVHPFSSSIERI